MLAWVCPWAMRRGTGAGLPGLPSILGLPLANEASINPPPALSSPRSVAAIPSHTTTSLPSLPPLNHPKPLPPTYTTTSATSPKPATGKQTPPHPTPKKTPQERKENHQPCTAQPHTPPKAAYPAACRATVCSLLFKYQSLKPSILNRKSQIPMPLNPSIAVGAGRGGQIGRSVGRSIDRVGSPFVCSLVAARSCLIGD